jgi:hypothetical protein
MIALMKAKAHNEVIGRDQEDRLGLGTYLQDAYAPHIQEVASLGLRNANERGSRGALGKLLCRFLCQPLSEVDVSARREAWMSSFNQKQQVLTTDHAAPYDYLVLAMGTSSSDFGHDAWQRWAPGLKYLMSKE